MEINLVSANSGFSISTQFLPAASSAVPDLCLLHERRAPKEQLPFPAHMHQQTHAPAWMWDKPPSITEAKPLLMSLALSTPGCWGDGVVCRTPAVFGPLCHGGGHTVSYGMLFAVQAWGEHLLAEGEMRTGQVWGHMGLQSTRKAPTQVRGTGIEGIREFISSPDLL